jgi:hypothetical protein
MESFPRWEEAWDWEEEPPERPPLVEPQAARKWREIGQAVELYGAVLEPFTA